MVFEVEKRARFKSMRNFNDCKRYLYRNAKCLGSREFVSFLFRKPFYVRIRLTKGRPTAMVTHKLGGYSDKAREETEFGLDRRQLKNFVGFLKSVGFKECASCRTTGFSYKLNGLRIDLNRISHLGLIIEVEALTDKRRKIDGLISEIDEVLGLLGLEELDSDTYQKMMDGMYNKTLKSISERSFTG